MEEIFEIHTTTLEATNAMIQKIIVSFDTEGTITGYTFSSIVSEMATLSEPIRNACSQLHEKIQDIYSTKLI